MKSQTMGGCVGDGKGEFDVNAFERFRDQPILRKGIGHSVEYSSCLVSLFVNEGLKTVDGAIYGGEVAELGSEVVAFSEQKIDSVEIGIVLDMLPELFGGEDSGR